jgi:hypothetical protein
MQGVLEPCGAVTSRMVRLPIHDKRRFRYSKQNCSLHDVGRCQNLQNPRVTRSDSRLSIASLARWVDARGRPELFFVFALSDTVLHGEVHPVNIGWPLSASSGPSVLIRKRRIQYRPRCTGATRATFASENSPSKRQNSRSVSLTVCEASEWTSRRTHHPQTLGRAPMLNLVHEKARAQHVQVSSSLSSSLYTNKSVELAPAPEV